MSFLKRHPWIEKAILVSCSTVISLLLAELFCAIFFPSPEVKTDILGRHWNPAKNGECPAYTTKYYKDYPYWDFRPNQKGKSNYYNEFSFAWNINGLGLRDKREINSSNPSHEYRILVLGDSQTFGYVNEQETFCAVLEREIRNSRHVSVEVLNAGVPGYGQYHCLWKLSRLIDLVRPNLIIAVVFVDNWLIKNAGNDLWSNYATHNALLTGRRPRKWWEPRKTSGLPIFLNLRIFLRNHVHLARPIAFGKNWLMGRENYSINSIREYCETKRSQDQNLNEAWRITQSLLMDIRDVGVKHARAETVVLYLPSIESLILKDKSALKKLQETGMHVGSTFDVLYSAGRNSRRFENLRYRTNAHYNAEANRIIGKQLFEFLQSQDLLDISIMRDNPARL